MAKKVIIGKLGAQKAFVGRKIVNPGRMQGADWSQTDDGGWSDDSGGWGDSDGWMEFGAGGGGKLGSVSNPARNLSRGVLKRNVNVKKSIKR